jgi:hypothetical protein
VVQGLIDAKSPLARHVVADFKPFDPAHPDALDKFDVPAEPARNAARPLGN